jgi:hypothetical protein
MSLDAGGAGGGAADDTAGWSGLFFPLATSRLCKISELRFSVRFPFLPLGPGLL